MEAGELWPMCLSDEQILAQMNVRAKSLQQSLKYKIFGTVLFALFTGWYVELLFTTDHTLTKIVFGLYTLWFLSKVRDWAEKWSETLENLDAIKAATSAWINMMGQTSVEKEFARTRLIEATIGLQASILAAQHNAHEAWLAKEHAKAQKKFNKKARKGASSGNADDQRTAGE